MDQVQPGVTGGVIVEPLPDDGEIRYGPTYTLVVLHGAGQHDEAPDPR